MLMNTLFANVEANVTYNYEDMGNVEVFEQKNLKSKFLILNFVIY